MIKLIPVEIAKNDAIEGISRMRGRVTRGQYRVSRGSQAFTKLAGFLGGEKLLALAICCDKSLAINFFLSKCVPFIILQSGDIHATPNNSSPRSKYIFFLAKPQVVLGHRHLYIGSRNHDEFRIALALLSQSLILTSASSYSF
jgi:hypothetical protein